MLLDLQIKNFTLIDSLFLEFGKELNVLTGETGAGKSIVLDAIGLLLGKKAESSTLRDKEKKCVIAGSFEIKKNLRLQQKLKQLGLENNEDLLLLRREIDGQNRSRAFVNDQPVSLTTLAELSENLIEIHGQHEGQKLLKTTEQRALLDEYADNLTLLQELEVEFSTWQKILNQLQDVQKNQQERTKNLDHFEFQLREIKNANLKIGEDETLEQELPALKNADKLRHLGQELYNELYDDQDSALVRLKRSLKSLETLQGLGIDKSRAIDTLQQTIENVQDLSDQAYNLSSAQNVDPDQIDAAIGRIDLIARLKKKYGGSIESVLAQKEKLQAEIDLVTNFDETVDKLKQQAQAALKNVEKICKSLSTSRKKAAEKFCVNVIKELKDLGFAKAEFNIEFRPENQPTLHGSEQVEFLFSANQGITAQALKSVASGGELSRLMLSIKKVFADKDPAGCLIFDEVDAGLGGATGHILGKKLAALAENHQVILVTHLAQIAAFAQNHFQVEKNIKGKMTSSLIRILSQQERALEIARMMGGIQHPSEKPSEIALKHAQELLNQALMK